MFMLREQRNSTWQLHSANYVGYFASLCLVMHDIMSKKWSKSGNLISQPPVYIIYILYIIVFHDMHEVFEDV